MSTSTVTPWTVKGNIDYKELIERFGTEYIDDELLQRFERLTGKPLHPWLKRKIFFSHRHLSDILDAYENGDPIFLYTGRGPTSDAMHIGHMIPFMFTKYLQDVFDCPLVIQMSDDEKYYFKQLDFETVYNLGFENAKDIIACGFNPNKTFIFSNRDYRLNVKEFEIFVSDMKKHYTAHTIQKIFGFDDTATIGQYDWPFYQSAPAFYQAFPHIFTKPSLCLVAYAIDQDPYFRMARDLADEMGLIKPCSIMCKFIPPLIGSEGKMSSSVSTDSTLFLNNTQDEIREKILKYSFSGGRDTLEEHRRLGGNPDVDIPYQYLTYFEYDDMKLEDIYNKFKNGILTSIEIKNIMADKIINLISNHQQSRAKITKEICDNFYSYKHIQLPEPIVKQPTQDELLLLDLLNKNNIIYDRVCHNDIENDSNISKIKNFVPCKLIPIESENKFILFITRSKNLSNKEMQTRLNIKKIKFVRKEIIIQCLGTISSPFSIINDHACQFKINVDKELINCNNIGFRSSRNDTSIIISCQNLINFIHSIGRECVVV